MLCWCSQIVVLPIGARRQSPPLDVVDILTAACTQHFPEAWSRYLVGEADGNLCNPAYSHHSTL